jgi:hypothetical protein
LTIQLGEVEFRGLWIINNFHDDQFFTREQQQRLSELMNMWRIARDQEQELSPEIQIELDNIVNLELNAATARSAFLAQQQNGLIIPKGGYNAKLSYLWFR